VIENDHGKKLDSLFVGYTQIYEKQMEHDHRFEKIEAALDKQDVEIRVIRSAKKLQITSLLHTSSFQRLAFW
jgi:hypothetical protein